MSLIPDHPGRKDIDAFMVWINTVLKHRHGGLRLPDKIVIFDEQWTTDQLSAVQRTRAGHHYDPRRPDEPVIVLRGLKTDYLLDGNRRINTWIRERSAELHQVWLVCPVYER